MTISSPTCLLVYTADSQSGLMLNEVMEFQTVALLPVCMGAHMCAIFQMLLHVKSSLYVGSQLCTDVLSILHYGGSFSFGCRRTCNNVVPIGNSKWYCSTILDGIWEGEALKLHWCCFCRKLFWPIPTKPHVMVLWQCWAFYYDVWNKNSARDHRTCMFSYACESSDLLFKKGKKGLLHLTGLIFSCAILFSQLLVLCGFSKQVVMKMRQTTWTETSSLIPHLRRPSACARLLNTTSSVPWSPTLPLTTTQMPRTSSSLPRKQVLPREFYR